MAGMREFRGNQGAIFLLPTRFMKSRAAGIFSNIRKGKSLLWQKA
jgi:hypothetical protein